MSLYWGSEVSLYINTYFGHVWNNLFQHVNKYPSFLLPLDFFFAEKKNLFKSAIEVRPCPWHSIRVQTNINRSIIIITNLNVTAEGTKKKNTDCLNLSEVKVLFGSKVFKARLCLTWTHRKVRARRAQTRPIFAGLCTQGARQ